VANECPKCKVENPDTQKFCGDCGTPLEADVIHTKTLETPIEELTTGSTFAERYQIIEELGKGGMGKVYKVLDKEANEKIALKLIKPEIAADKKTIERFRNELTTARKIAQRNVCQMYDLNKDKDNYYITMEYVPGEDLKSLIRRVKVDIGTSIKIAKQICEGLSEAHRLGVVHRDLKPSNIMIDKEGNARIMDFGIARSVKGKGITGSGVMIGTPEYMSPEQVEAKDIDQRSDIYSLGIIMYEMLTGRLPFEADTPFAVGVKHKSEIPKNPHEFNPQIPDDLSGVILKCLKKDKKDRYKSAGEVISELEKIEQGLLTKKEIEPKSEPKTVKIGEIKLKNLILYGGISILLLAAIFVGIFLLMGRQKAIDSIAVLPFENRSGDPELDYWSEGITEDIISKLRQLPSLKKVTARTSVFHYKGKEIIPQKVGMELGVDVVLISQIEKRGEELTIRTELVDTDDGSRIWGKPYTLELSEIFNVQDQITNSIAENLNLKPTSVERENLTKRYTENVEAYNLYIQGRYFWNMRTEDGFNKAIEKFKLAFKLDPNYALALVGISDCYNLLPFYSNSVPKEKFPKAKEAVLKALEIDKALAEAHTSLAWIKFRYDWDWESSEKEFMKAIELNPGYATTHFWYAMYLSHMGRIDEAIKEMKISLELDPVSIVINKDSSTPYYCSRQYDKVMEILQNTAEMDPNFPTLHFLLGRQYFCRSMYKKALEAFKEERAVRRDWSDKVEAHIGITYANMGLKEEALQVLEELIEHSKYEYVSPILLAKLYFDLGEKTLYQDSLDTAFEERAVEISELKTDPFYDNLRSDRAFIELLKRVDLLDK